LRHQYGSSIGASHYGQLPKVSAINGSVPLPPYPETLFPDGPDGIALARHIKTLAKGARVFLVTSLNNWPFAATNLTEKEQKILKLPSQLFTQSRVRQKLNTEKDNEFSPKAIQLLMEKQLKQCNVK
jgi:hypothetical protein